MSLYPKTFFNLARPALAAVALASAALPAAAANSVIDTIIDRGSLRVGMSSFVPWAMRDKQGGFIGFEIDVARQLAADMDVELELVPTKWDGLIPALITGKFDLIIGGMSITSQRALKINFTSPYANSGLDIVANRAKLPGASSLEDINRPDVIIAMRRGVSGIEHVKRLMPQAQIRQFDDDASCRQEVVNGNAHAWVSSAPQPAFVAADHPEQLYLPLAGTFAQSTEAIGMRRGDTDALAFLNGWIASRAASGWLRERHDFWFRTKDWSDEVEAES